MILIYNPNTDSYEGRRVCVPRWLWDEGVADLVDGGTPEAEARRRLLEEAEWVDVEGTDLLPLCGHCRKPLAPGREFCNVLCQATFIAEVHSG